MQSNPFSTRFVQPGRLEWIASSDASTLKNLKCRFLGPLRGRAAIVGPHGSGKSSLLEHLVPTLGPVVFQGSAHEQPVVPEIEYQADDIVWLRLRGLAASNQLVASCLRSCRQAGVMVVVDGYEQLSMLARIRLVLQTNRRGQKLLLTSHKTTWLPTLVRTQVTTELAVELLQRLLPECDARGEQLIDSHELGQLLQKHHGNMREVFMELYDLQQAKPPLPSGGLT